MNEKNHQQSVKGLSVLIILFLTTSVLSGVFLPVYSAEQGENEPLDDDWYEVIVEVDQGSYYLGETVYLSILLLDNGTAHEGQVCPKVLNPNDDQVYGGFCGFTNEFGYFNDSFVLDPFDPFFILGTYLVNVEGHFGTYGEIIITTNITFDVVSDTLEIDAHGPYNGVPFNPIEFQGSAEGGKPPYTWLWDFGDGNTSDEQNPVHSYDDYGVYTVNLTVEDSGDLVAEDSTMSIISNYTLTVETDQYYYYTGEIVIISGTLKLDGVGIPGVPLLISLYLPDDNVSTIITPPTDGEGRFQVRMMLPLASPLGLYDVEALFQGVDVPAYTSFEVVSSEVIVTANGPYEETLGESISFQGDAEGGKPPYTWQWDFGDGNTSDEQNPEHTYEMVDTYEVTLTVYDNGSYEGNDSTTATITQPSERTHTVLVEYGSYTTCEPCVTASDQLEAIYDDEEGSFYYVSLVIDENTEAEDRADDLGIDETPDVYFDGGYTHIFGEQSSSTPYRNALEDTATRNVWDIDLDINVSWLEGAEVGMNLTIVNNDDDAYNGTVRFYIVEPLSRWNNYDGEPYHYAVLDIVSQQISVDAEKEVKKTWDGDDHDFGDVCENNIMIIAAVFHEDNEYADETVSGMSSSSFAIQITKPLTGFYIRDMKLREYLFRQNPFILGKLTIEVEVLSCGSEVESVEFYIDDEEQETDTSSPYDWLWEQRYFLLSRHTIKVVATDTLDNTASDELTVWKLF